MHLDSGLFLKCVTVYCGVSHNQYYNDFESSMAPSISYNSGKVVIRLVDV